MKKRLSNLVKSSVMGIMIAAMLCVNVFAGTASVDQAPMATTAEAVADTVDTVAGEGTFLNISKKGFTDVEGIAYTSRKAVMRSKPSSKGKKICNISKLKGVTLTGLSKNWCRVEYKGKTGYVANKYFSHMNYSEKINIDISNVPEEKIQQIKSLIVWETEYSKEIEDTIISELNKLPDTIYNAYLNVANNNIKIVSSLDRNNTYSTGTPIGRIFWQVDYGVVTKAEIHMVNTVDAVKRSMLHEIGHYVDVAFSYAGYNSDLPYYASDAYRFSTTEYNGFDYYASSEDEYFAELFRYTISNGPTEKYIDSLNMQYIIDNFRTN